METLDSPVFEVKQDSQWHKDTVFRNQKRKEFFKELSEKYLTDNGFAFYHEGHFGIYGHSKDYETYKDELTKNPDKNGIHTFKKRSKYHKIFKEMLEGFEDKYSPFKAHDVFGTNNMKASQWLGDRWFWSVKDKSQVVGDEVEPLDYKDYLKVVMEHVEE
ncbi:hypothetical protein [Gracilibacillus sp. YIM 98692]|uniref:hypothetical protein n=1 Tax=Gracilibacillus sp. YIM 98692 TaxID=2663532 RepID=UPI0013D4542A|nr:hypothetical protein [Gracilibacillus sp. YIM 98692]